MKILFFIFFNCFQLFISYSGLDIKIKKICNEKKNIKVYECISNGRTGFANQLLAFQYLLYKLKNECQDSSVNFLLTGPYSDHVSNNDVKLNFFDFFRIRTNEECENIISDFSRKTLCKQYENLLKKITFIDKNTIKNENTTIKLVGYYCMPWKHHSIIGRKLHCKNQSIKDMLFFFEIFEFNNYIFKLGFKFMQLNNLRINHYSALHFRGGDFSKRKLKNAYKSFSLASEIFNGLIKRNNINQKKFYMIQSKEDIFGKKIFLSEEWLFNVTRIEHQKCISCIKFTKILLDIFISSKSSYFVGNHYSTLTEIVISYGKLRSNAFNYSFY